MTSLAQLKREQLALMQHQQQRQDNLPHLYGMPWYDWAWEFFNNEKDSIQLLCAANQISKSSTQIRKCIYWATEKELWPKLWPGHKHPNMFWYLYPSKDIATAEWKTKWSQFMPSGSMRDDPKYGWKEHYDKKAIHHIDFNSGMTVYFKTYMQDAQLLQAGSVFSIFGDEELPEHLYDELMLRIGGTDGFFHMVFTATIGQLLWFRAMEMIGNDLEFLPQAWKRSVSMYECMEYQDGRPSPWNLERIKKIEARCKSTAEINRRVHGRFVKTEGRLFHAFDPTVNYVTPFPIPKGWARYAGVDIGSGGVSGHPSAICFIAVKPCLTEGYIYKAWRGDKIPTTAGDVFEKYHELLDEGETITRKVYDYAAVDFGTISMRSGDPFQKAQKSHDLGHDLINTLLKNRMLHLFDNEEVRKLGSEWISVIETTPKNKRKDDLSDATRYACVEIPWDLTKIVPLGEDINSQPKEDLPKNKNDWVIKNLEDQRNGRYKGPDDVNDPTDWGELEGDFAEMNELYGN